MYKIEKIPKFCVHTLWKPLTDGRYLEEAICGQGFTGKGAEQGGPKNLVDEFEFYDFQVPLLGERNVETIGPRPGTTIRLKPC